MAAGLISAIDLSLSPSCNTPGLGDCVSLFGLLSKCHRLGGLTTAEVYCSQLGAWESKIQMLADLVSAESLLLTHREPSRCVLNVAEGASKL